MTTSLGFVIRNHPVILRTWKWRQHVSRKRYLPASPNDVATQQTSIARLRSALTDPSVMKLLHVKCISRSSPRYSFREMSPWTLHCAWRWLETTVDCPVEADREKEREREWPQEMQCTKPNRSAPAHVLSARYNGWFSVGHLDYGPLRTVLRTASNYYGLTRLK